MRPANGAPSQAGKSMSQKLSRAMSRSASTGVGASTAGLWEVRCKPPPKYLGNGQRFAKYAPAEAGMPLRFWYCRRALRRLCVRVRCCHVALLLVQALLDVMELARCLRYEHV